MIGRALLVWVALLAIAFANGALREFVIVPRIGDLAGHAVSSVTLSVGILLLSWFTIAWIHPASAREAWVVASVWVALTLAFEFLAGHYVFGHAWSRLLADYNVFRGRIWVLVLITTAVAPVLTASARGLFAPRG
jgi:hypothetical protein